MTTTAFVALLIAIDHGLSYARAHKKHFVQKGRNDMFDEEYTGEFQEHIWKAGEIVPAGTYVRIDELPYRVVTLESKGPLPATFDGHIACYRTLPRMDIKQIERRPVMVC
jgi:hypothetical protein